MAVKGNGYIKTTWSFQERPVASLKLNNWDDQIESAVELIHEILSLAWGGGNGVLRAATANNLQVVAASPPNMTVVVKAGRAFISKFVYKLASDTTSPAVTAPATHPRIDLVQAVLSTWSVSIKTGTEATSPAPPSPDADCIGLAQIYCRVGMTSIKNSDDGVNGYITDVRQYL